MKTTHRYQPRRTNPMAIFHLHDRWERASIDYVSVMGCVIRSHIPLYEGQALGLELLLRPRHRAIAVPYALVRWIDGELMGLEFLSIAVRDHARLHRLVADYGSLWNSLYHQTSPEDGPYG